MPEEVKRNLSIEQISPTQLRLTIEVPFELLKGEIDSAYDQLRRTAEISGFRRGKAPRKLLERAYGDAVLADVKQKSVTDWFNRIVIDENLKLIGEPEIEKVEFQVDKPLVFVAKVDVRPEITVSNYRGIEVEVRAEKLGYEQVNAELERLRQSVAKLKPVEDRGAEKGDVAVVDISGVFDDGEAVPGGKKSGISLEVGSEGVAPEISAGLVGMKPGETRDVEIAFKPDHTDERLRGRNVHYTVSLKELKQKLLPELDDEFARDVGSFNTLEDLRTSIRENLEKAVRVRTGRLIEEEVASKLVEATPFEVPISMVRAHKQRLVENFALEMVLAGTKKEEISENLGQLDAELEKRAVYFARRALILEWIADREKLTVSDAEVEARLSEIARESNQPVEKVKEVYSRDNGMMKLRHRMRGERGLDFLASHARIKTV